MSKKKEYESKKETVTENQEIEAVKDENDTVSKSDSDDVAAYIF